MPCTEILRPTCTIEIVVRESWNADYEAAIVRVNFRIHSTAKSTDKLINLFQHGNLNRIKLCQNASHQ